MFKVFAFSVAAFAQSVDNSNGDKLVRHPIQRLERLESFINEWLDDNFRGTNVKTHWMAKFKRNSDRMEMRFNICGAYDDRRRRETTAGDAIITTPDSAYDYDYDYDYDESSDEVLDFARYDKTNPVNGLRQITVAYKKWAQRFISKCKLQPRKQALRSELWNAKLKKQLLKKINA